MKLIYTIAALLLMLQAGATVRYVRAGAPAGGNGLTWATAYNNLETALNASTTLDQVWVSAGTYTPSSTGSFAIKTGVQVYGGFPATGSPAMADTNWKANKTILQKGNTNHSIVEMSSANLNTILNGFYIQNGSGDNGGGLYISGSGSTVAAPIIQNMVFDRCIATNQGGGVFIASASPIMINITFQNCKAAYGGGVGTADAAPDMRRCAFEKDTALTDGGAINYNGTPTSGVHGIFTDVVMYNCRAGRSGGGSSIQGDGALPKFLNCTFVNNYSAQSINNTGGAIYTYSGTTTNSPNPIITNCLFFGNTNSQGPLDVGAFRSNNTITYSYYSTATTGTNGNVLSTTASPFNDINLPKGADGIWLTADDGLVPSICGGRVVIDKGINSAISYTVDAAYLPRKIDVAFVADGGSGTSPIVDMGAYENQNTTTIAQIAGVIQGNDTIPSPQEQAADTIKSVTAPINATGMVIQWQSKTGTNNWKPAVGTNNLPLYRFTTLDQSTRFRRAVVSSTYCDTVYSNEMEMYVYDPFLTANDIGVIKGRISSRSNAAISGVKISIIRLGTSTSGGPVGYEYPNVTTGSDGTFTKTGIYYGPSNQSVDSFLIKPFLAGHRIITIINGDTVESVKVKLQKGNAKPDSIRFTDITVFSVQGATYQRCLGCVDASGAAVNGYKTCPIDGVKITSSPATDPGISYIVVDTARYGLNIINSGTYVLTPSYKNHRFSPSSLSVPVTGNVYNQNFEDIRQDTISGKVTAGCGEFIGTTELEFTDSLATTNGVTRASCFRKRITTGSDGSYKIYLPAGKYKVKVVKFFPFYDSNLPDYVSENEVLAFFAGNRLPVDSFYRNIDSTNAELNLVYQRPPVIALVQGLDTFCSPGVSRGYALIQQAVVDSFRLKIYQGRPTANGGAGCLVTDTSKPLVVFTSIQANDLTDEQLSFPNSDTGVVVKLVGGIPNSIETPTAPFRKKLEFYYTDQYGRNAPTLPIPVVVLGVKPDAGAQFTTVSPQIPLLVLHDPPGDQSFSKWINSQTRESALRFYAQSSAGAKAYQSIKLGTKTEVEVFGVGTEFEFWGKVDNAITVQAANNTANELLLSTSSSFEYQTSSNPLINSSNGDLFVGTALNLIYAGSDEVSYSNCQLKKERKLIIASDGFAPKTDYIYAEYQIRNDIIPSLYALAASNRNDSARYFIKQAKIWEQLLENNDANKRKASFQRNVSWGGASGPATYTSSQSVSNSNSLDFSLTIKRQLAAELGFEVGGSGVTDGIDINVKMETGQSNTNTITHQTETSYTFADQNIGDLFNVNVKKDPVYNTPVFELLGGRSSSPVEQGTYPRDQFEIYPVPSQLQGVPANGVATFQLHLQNTNATESRYYWLTFEQSSNPYGARIQVGGSDYTTPQYYIIPPASEQLVTVNVIKPLNSNVYSFEGLQFSINDSSYRASKTCALSVFFQSPCSSIKLGYPENNWVLSGSANNVLPVLLQNYTATNLSSIRLEYAKVGTSNWLTGFTLNNTNLNPDSTTYLWNVQSIADGAYKLRVALNCSSGTTYTESTIGIIDRQAPTLFGKPEPSDNKYVNGDQVSFTYSEKLGLDSLNNGKVTMRRLSNNTLIPVTVSGYDNRIMIIANSPITAYLNDTLQVIAKGMTDVYGNPKLTADTIVFSVGNSVINTGNNVLKVGIINPVLYKNSDSTMYVKFSIPVNSTFERRINYAVSGTARLGVDYTLVDSVPAAYSYFNGIMGSTSIKQSSQVAYLKIKPIGNYLLDSNKTIIINLNEGGDYLLDTVTTVKGTITSQDGISIYTFTGNGNFDIRSNWLNSKMPLTTIVAGKTINIDPATGGKCIVNVPVTLKQGSTLNVKSGKDLLVPGNLKLN